VITWVKQAVGLAVFGFLNLVLFIALSNPFGMLMDTVSEEATKMGVGSAVLPFIANFRMIFGLVFILSTFGLFIWIFLNSHHEEYSQY